MRTERKRSEISDLAGVNNLLKEINALRDLDTILDRLLLVARRITSADAGSIFLVRDDGLELSYSQNQTLSGEQESRERYRSMGLVLPLTRESIAGYVAITGESLLLDDPYHTPEDADYRFDGSVDERLGYRTQSMLTLPIQAVGRPSIGVLQLINALDDSGDVTVFSPGDESAARLLAGQAAMAIEHARMTRALTMRMISMAGERDPKETASHVNRVADSSVEIYKAWAAQRHIPEDEARAFVDRLRIAAVLHDVGKIGIPDAVLKKPGKLDDEEYARMKQHTVIGARLFRERMNDVDDMAADVALGHHERWDGRGYPGRIEDVCADPIVFGKGKRGEEIPLAARIVSLADVYDALTSKRCYKDAWSDEKARQTVVAEAGKQFDPGVVDAFVSVYDVIQAVRDRHTDQ